MAAPNHEPLTIADHLPAAWELLEPDCVGAPLFYPILGEGPHEYAAFTEALRDGAVAKELPEPSVN